MFKVNSKYCPSASTILARKCLAKCNGQSSLPKEDGTYAGSKNGCSETEAISKSLELKKTSVDQKELHRRKDKLDSLPIIKDLKEVYDEVAQQFDATQCHITMDRSQYTKKTLTTYNRGKQTIEPDFNTEKESKMELPQETKPEASFDMNT
ncbi:hypothetical protein L345_03710, partial [Ophiophagus hannah]